MSNYHPADRPDPSEQPLRARVPDHVSGGAFSTGVIVMTAQTEFILDFVQNLGRPHQIVSRVVMPHNVLPQLVDALHRNMELYRGRWGALPHTPGLLQPAASPVSLKGQPSTPPNPMAETESTMNDAKQDAEQPARQDPSQTLTGASSQDVGAQAPTNIAEGGESRGDDLGQKQPAIPQQPSGARQASAQEIYDDLKIRDELLSGAYANAVMIGHGPHEFSFDFITNFYPHSAVSARVFLAAGQVPRLYDSLKGTWDQMRARLQAPFGPPPKTDDNPPMA
jgi:hypothetical protein